MLSLVVVMLNTGVHLFKVTSKDGFLVSLSDDIDIDTMEELVFGCAEEVFWRVPFALGDGIEFVVVIVVR